MKIRIAGAGLAGAGAGGLGGQFHESDHFISPSCPALGKRLMGSVPWYGVKR
jgi:hypothetical protein